MAQIENHIFRFAWSEKSMMDLFRPYFKYNGRYNSIINPIVIELEKNMSNRHQERALKVVNSFKHILHEDACQLITDAQFEELALMVNEAIADELNNCAELVENVVKQIRGELNKPSLGM